VYKILSKKKDKRIATKKGKRIGMKLVGCIFVGGIC